MEGVGRASRSQNERRILRRVPAYIIMIRRDGAPEEIRTPDPQIRSLVLYPAELRVRTALRAGPGI